MPTDISYEALFSKYLVAHFYKVICLSVINRDKYHSVIRQQVPCHFQTRIDHIEPIGMEAAIALGVGNETVALLVKLPGVGEVFGR